nr:hypothetical protein [Tanacetum cinerariifolium]
MSYLTNYKEIDGGYVAFRGNPKGGKITRKCTIKIGNLDFENIYFVRELKFNLFSVSQMCDKKNSALFNDIECIVLSPNFKLIDESQVLLTVPRKNNIYSVDLKNIVPKGGLTCLFAKATSDESKLWHRRLGSGPDWLFDIDALTRIMNYEPIDAGIRSNSFAGTKASDNVGQARKETEHVKDYILLPLWTTDPPFSQDPKSSHDDGSKPSSTKASDNVGQARKETEPVKDYILLPLWTTDPPFSQDPKSSHDDGSKPSSDDGKKVDENLRNESECKDQEKEDNVNCSTVNVTGINENNELLFVLNIPVLEDVSIFNFSNDDEDDGTMADMNNFDTTIQDSPIPTIKIHKDHPLDQVIRDLQSTTQIRKMSKNLKEHGFVITIQQRTNHKDLQNYLFACFYHKTNPKRFLVYQIDVKSDFLYGKIEEEVYVCQPSGFQDPDFPKRVYKVEKALYGLHQALRAWYETLSTYLLDNGFHRGKINKTLFIKRHKGNILLMSSTGELTFFLGLQVKQKKYGTFISKDKYVDNILKKFRFIEIKTASTPMETQKPLLKDKDGKEVDVHVYRFWSTAMAKTINGEVQMHAQVDGKEIVITESSVRRDLQLADEEDEAVHKELGDSLVRAATTASSFEVEQDSGAKKPCRILLLKLGLREYLNIPIIHYSQEYRGEYLQWVERFMNYLEEQTDGEAMIDSIKNGDQQLPRVTQVSIAGTSSTEQPHLKDKSMWSDQEKRIQKIDRLARSLLIQGLSNDIYSLIDSNKTAKDLWDALSRHMLGFEYGEQDRKAAVLYEYETFKATEGELLLDTYIQYLQVINDLKKCGYSKDNYVNDAMGSKKKTVVVTSDPLALIAEKMKVCKSKEKVVVSSDSEGNKDEQVLLAKDQAWMQSSSDSDQEINANMVSMAQIEKVLFDSKASSSSADEKISEPPRGVCLAAETRQQHKGAFVWLPTAATLRACLFGLPRQQPPRGVCLAAEQPT